MNKYSSTPILAVGLLTAPEVNISFHDGFPVTGTRKFTSADVADGPLTFAPIAPGATFTVHDAVIGIGFHWQQNLDLTFGGSCRIIADGDNVTVINDIDIESYLKSVISSEMSATASPALLRAHAIISRSWVLAQILSKGSPDSTDVREGDIYASGNGIPGKNESSGRWSDDSDDTRSEDETEIIKWYDHDDHTLYDVCADDHCQRYQGVTRITTPEAEAAVEATRGMVLTDREGNLCDARFSKCCGGAMEKFSSCWDDRDFHYLAPRRDADEEDNLPDLSNHDEAHRWIMSRPEAWCDCTSSDILGQVLNNFDLITKDFYRWKVIYTASELSELVSRRSGIDFGLITSLEPIERGASGRITRLRITGSRRSAIIGKELEIRRILSESHLYSSAFTIETSLNGQDNSRTKSIRKETGASGSQDRETVFTLHGAGWGHGVGLCQIGAAVMATRGYTHDAILAHYYPGSSLTPAW